MAKTLYDDGRYSLTWAIVATPRRFYPLAHTTASLRRDPLWIAIGVSGFAVACLIVYGDLLYPIEIIALFAITGVSMVIGGSLSVLRLDATGHRRTFIVDRSSRLKKLYLAIRDAREIDCGITPDSDNICAE